MSNVRRITNTGLRSWRATTAAALDAQCEQITTAMVVHDDLVAMLGQELVMEQGTVQTSHLEHEIRALDALLRSARTERLQQAERLRAADRALQDEDDE